MTRLYRVALVNGAPVPATFVLALFGATLGWAFASTPGTRPATGLYTLDTATGALVLRLEDGSVYAEGYQIDGVIEVTSPINSARSVFRCCNA